MPEGFRISASKARLSNRQMKDEVIWLHQSLKRGSRIYGKHPCQGFPKSPNPIICPICIFLRTLKEANLNGIRRFRKDDSYSVFSGSIRNFNRLEIIYTEQDFQHRAAAKSWKIQIKDRSKKKKVEAFAINTFIVN